MPIPRRTLRQVLRTGVDAPPGLAHALHRADDVLAVRAVLELDVEGARGLARLDLVAGDEALLAEHLGDAHLHARGGHLHRVLPDRRGVADPRQHVGDGVGHHGWISYQEDLRMPGISPRRARSRRQMRQIPNLRYTARGRPQISQRRTRRLENFGLAFALWMRAVLAMGQIRSSRPVAEGHAELLQEEVALLVVGGRRHERDVHALGVLELVEVDLREDRLLGQPQRVVAATVQLGPSRRWKSRIRGRTIAIRRSANSHMRSPRKRHRDADRHALAQLEAGDRLARLAHGRTSGR